MLQEEKKIYSKNLGLLVGSKKRKFLIYNYYFAFTKRSYVLFYQCFSLVNYTIYELKLNFNELANFANRKICEGSLGEICVLHTSANRVKSFTFRRI